MTDLPPASIAAALELVGAVRDRDAAQVAHVIRNAAGHDGLEALAVTLASMVDDTQTLAEMLAWTGEPDVQAWRRSLTDKDCAAYAREYKRGGRDAETVDGYREFERRRVRKVTRKVSRQMRAKAAA